MKITRAILSGILVWTLIFITFTIMSFIPVVKNSELQQFMVVYIIVIPITILGVRFYYKKGNGKGLYIGLIIVLTALILDAIITVPLVIIPHNGNYSTFFINPLLWLLVAELIIIAFLYWKGKAKPNNLIEK